MTDSQPETGKTFTFSIALIEHVITSKTQGPNKVKKSKTKELEFTVAESDTEKEYINFLAGLLSQHGIDSKFLCSAKTFPYQYFFPPVKKTNAVSVDTFNEYIKMVKALITRVPKMANVIIDMEDIESCQSPVSMFY